VSGEPGKRIFVLLTVAGVVNLFSVCLLAGSSAGINGKAFDPAAPQCGHWAILRSCELLGVPIQMKTILKLLPPDERGASMLQLRNVFRQIGLEAIGRRETLEGLIRGPLPFIAHLDGDHFVTISAVNDEVVRFFDGDGHPAALTVSEFERKWTGALLSVQREKRDLPLPLFANRTRRNLPCIEFESLIIDKGNVPWRGKAIVYEFSVCNTGEAPLVISDIKTDCRCLGAERPHAPIAPGGKGTIVLKYSLKEGQGPFKHEALVKSNDPSVPLVKLTAAGSTDARVQTNPRRVYLGRIVPGQIKTARVCVHFTGDFPLEIRKVSCEEGRVKVTQRFLSQDSAHEFANGMVPDKELIGIMPNTHVLQLTYEAGTGEMGKRRIDTVVIHTNIDGFEQISVPVFASVVKPVGLYPSILVFWGVKPDETLTKTVEVASWDGSQFEIVSVSAGDSEISYFTTPGFAKRKTLSLSAKGANLLSLSDASLKIDVDVRGALAKRYTLELPIYVRP